MIVSTTRRRVLQGLAASGAAGTTAMPWIGARAADTLVVNGYGGEFQEVFQKTTIEPFEKKFGVKITYDLAGMSTETYARIRASRGTPGFDVAAELNESDVILGAKEQLLEPLSEKEVPNLKYLWPRSRKVTPTGAIHYYQFISLIWNKSKIDKPESWLDYWYPEKKYGEKIKGNVIAFNPTNTLAVFAMMLGAKAAGSNVLDMDLAFNLLRHQKPYVGTVVTASAQAAPYFENGQVWIAPYWSARANWYMAHGYPIDMTVPKEGTIGLSAAAAVPVGASNKKLAFEFVNFRLDPDIQRAFCLGYYCSPGRSDMTDWPKEYAEKQITTQEQMDRMMFIDPDLLSQKRRDWTMQWQEIMGA